MKVLIFLSRVAFICNLFFIAAMIMWYLENAKKGTGSKDALVDPGFFTGTIVTLEFLAIFLNTFMAIAYLVVAIGSKGRKTRLPAWLVISNLIIYCVQLYFFFV